MLEAPSPTRQRLRYLWIVGVALYLGFVVYVGWEDVAIAVRQIAPMYLIVFVAAEISVLLIRIAKWKIVLPYEPGVVKLAFLSKAGGNLTPGRVGEFSPLLMERYRSSRTGAWIVLDRLFEAAATLVLGVLGLVAVLGVVQGRVLLVISVLILGGIVLFCGVLVSPGTVRRLKGIELRFGPLKNLVSVLATVSAEFSKLRPRMPVVFGISILATGIDLVIGWLLYKSLGFDVAFAVLAVAQVTHAVTSVIPVTPNATGVPYAAAAAVLHEVGAVSLEALAVAVGLRMILGNAVFWVMFLIGTRDVPTGESHGAG